MEIESYSKTQPNETDLEEFLADFYAKTTMSVNSENETVLVSAQQLLGFTGVFVTLTGRKLVRDFGADVYFQAENGGLTTVNVGLVQSMIREIRDSAPDNFNLDELANPLAEM